MSRVAIVLPGQSYGVDQPGLAIPIEVARAAGYVVTCVVYPPSPWPDWRRAEAGDWSEITDGVARQLPPNLETEDVLVIAKSMGTSVFGGIRHLLPSRCDAIWITPLFGDPDVRAEVTAAGFRSLSIFGTADTMHDPGGQREVGGEQCAIEGANHGLIVEGDNDATVAGYNAIRAAVESFLGYFPLPGNGK